MTMESNANIPASHFSELRPSEWFPEVRTIRFVTPHVRRVIVIYFNACMVDQACADKQIDCNSTALCYGKRDQIIVRESIVKRNENRTFWR